MLKTSAQSKAGTEAGGLPRDRKESLTSPEGDRTYQRLAEAGLIEDQSSAESRLDPITGNWTIFAPGRDSRPNEFVATPQTETAVDLACPFCSGGRIGDPATGLGGVSVRSTPRCRFVRRANSGNLSARRTGGGGRQSLERTRRSE